MAETSEALFPALPEDITTLSDEELEKILDEFEVAAKKVAGDGPESQEYLGDLDADEILAQFDAAKDHILALRKEQDARVEAHEAYKNKRGEIAEELFPTAQEGDSDDNGEGDDAGDGEGDDAEAGDDAEGKVDPVAEQLEAVAASGETEAEVEAEKPAEKPRLRRPPAPTRERIVVNESDNLLEFVASGLVPSTPPGAKLDTREKIVDAVKKMAYALGPPVHHEAGREDKYMVASLDYKSRYPEERTLHASDWEANMEKIRAIGSPFFGREGVEALRASGGLCAPLEPIYTMPNFAVADTPVFDSLPTMRVQRGGVNVPTPTTISDASGAVTTITEANDALGGTFATKACLDMDCPTYTETAVTIIAACREFGNLNAMAWPEKIAHELEITRAYHARVAEGYILDRIKAQAINVTNGAETLGALIYLVDGIVKSAFGIKSRLRMDPESRLRVLLPAVLPDLLMLDNVQTQYDRFQSEEQLVAYLRSYDIEPTFYLDTPSTGTSQIADSSQTAAALDGLPDTIQWAIFPEGAFLGIDMAELNLGLVRDSVLNSTNDFQYFWENFINVALIGPAQSAYWVTSDLCASGQFPPAGTVRTCD